MCVGRLLRLRKIKNAEYDLTANSLDMIVSGVAKAAELVGQIAIASNEQATGIAQINKGIEQVAMVTQTNSATAEESAAASEELSGQAELLKEMVGKFRLKKSWGMSGDMEGDFSSNPRQISSPKQLSFKENKSSSRPKLSLGGSEFGKY